MNVQNAVATVQSINAIFMIVIPHLEMRACDWSKFNASHDVH